MMIRTIRLPSFDAPWRNESRARGGLSLFRGFGKTSVARTPILKDLKFDQI